MPICALLPYQPDKPQAGLTDFVLKNAGDKVTILGFTHGDVVDSLGYDHIISVNGGPLQYVDGTPFEGNSYIKLDCPWTFELIAQGSELMVKEVR